MSLAKKCDRCGICFDPYNIKGRMGRFVNPIFQTSDDICEQFRGQLLDEELGVDGIIDLCPDCAKAFREFMNRNPNPDNLPAAVDTPLQDVMTARVQALRDFFNSLSSSSTT